MGGSGVRRRARWLPVLLVLGLSACSEHAAEPPTVATPTSKEPAPHPVSWTWQPAAPRSFVPQGLARAGDRLFISGYRWAPARADQLCHVIVLDTTDATTVTEATELRDAAAPVSTPGGAVCHHGGGVAYSRAGLWVAGSGRLWLVDPERPGRVRRSWTVAPGIRASTLAVNEGRMWIGKYSVDGRGRIGQVEIRDLLAPGVTGVSPRGGAGMAQAQVRPAPNFVQGMAIDHRGLWLSRSSTRCGDLVRPGGAHRRLVPGAEGLVLVGRHRAWVLSESGAHHYQRLGGRPDVPMLSFVDFHELAEGQCFRA